MRESVPSQRESQLRVAPGGERRGDSVPEAPHSGIRFRGAATDTVRASAAVFALLWARV